MGRSVNKHAHLNSTRKSCVSVLKQTLDRNEKEQSFCGQKTNSAKRCPNLKQRLEYHLLKLHSSAQFL